MNSETYEMMCLKCCQGSIEEKTTCENELYTHIQDKRNLNQILDIIKNSNSEYTHFVTAEIINKVYSSPHKIGPVESFSSDRYEKDENFEINQEFVKTYIQLLSTKGETMQSYLLNTIANYVGNAVRLNWLEIKNKEGIILGIKDDFFSNAHMIKRINIGLKLFEYILSNLFINTQYMSY